MENLFSVPLLPRMNVPDESDWLPAARLGEPWALEQFYDCYQAQVYALCHRLLGCSEDAEDAMQATFVQAFRALPGFRGDSSAKTWLYRIAVNQAISLLRKRKNASHAMEEGVEVSDAAPGVMEQIAVRHALARIRPKYRVILVLRFWEELTYEEIASVLRLPLATVRMRLKRTKDEFRIWYEEDG